MGVRLSLHPPYAVAGKHGGSDQMGERVSLLHAKLWVRIEIEEWHLVREGHLHLVSAPDAARAGMRWREVELSRHPLFVYHHGSQVPEDAEDLLHSELSRLSIEVFRQRELGLASEIGETRAAFERRLLKALRPLVQERIGVVKAGGRPKPGGGSSRTGVAEALSGLASGIEHRTVRATEDVVVSAELGLLLIPEDDVPTTTTVEDRMITGRPMTGPRR